MVVAVLVVVVAGGCGCACGVVVVVVAGEVAKASQVISSLHANQFPRLQKNIANAQVGGRALKQ